MKYLRNLLTFTLVLIGTLVLYSDSYANGSLAAVQGNNKKVKNFIKEQNQIKEQNDRAVQDLIDGYQKDGQLAKAYKNILEAKSSGKPLMADPNTKRVRSYIMSKTGVSDTVAEMIRIGSSLEEIKKESNLDDDKLNDVAFFLGQYLDQYFGVEFLALARAAADSVARIVYANEDNKARGTGFMISEKLFMTNNHVISTKDSFPKVRAEFNYENDYRHDPDHIKSVSKFHFDPETFFITSHRDILDYTIVAMGGQDVEGVDNPGEVKALSHFGYCPLGNNEQLIGQFANVIQHPLGHPKAIALRENRVFLEPDSALSDKILYDSDAINKSSGSPVFDDDFKPVALHKGSIEKSLDENTKRTLSMGIKISAIINDLRKRRMAGEEGITEAQWELLDTALGIADTKPLPSNIYGSEEDPE